MRVFWIIEDDTPGGIRLTTDDIGHSVRKRHIQVPEGGSARYKIWLTQPPTKDVTVGHTFYNTDPDITVSTPNSHTFARQLDRAALGPSGGRTGR